MQDALSNIPVFSVSQISAEVKRTVEDRFQLVRIRGEVSRPTRARSGHFYVTLKDERAVIDAVAWKAVAAKFDFDISEGMELIATGKLTTYPGQSKYQLVIESLELAGEGALLKMLEERRKTLLSEGLFDPARKKTLPLLPRRVGVVSSPNGAVIRDIWHRVSDRFPMPVLLWPVLVQGQGAAMQVTKAIEGFSALPQELRPDVLIIARGGGSLEDLWTFNEESVVRAAAACPIPLVSAIGHETDTTLLDFAADVRAPTPTAAAEFCVPIRHDLLAQVQDGGARLDRGVRSRIETYEQGLRDLGHALADPNRPLAQAMQDLDLVTDQLHKSQQIALSNAGNRVEQAAAQLRHPRSAHAQKSEVLRNLNAASRLDAALGQLMLRCDQEIELLWSQLTADRRAREQLQAQGWVTVQNEAGKTLTSATQIKANALFSLHFHDGPAKVMGTRGLPPKRKLASPPRDEAKQETLF